MAVVRPFKGLRPRKELADKVAALPYDVMNSEEARKMADGNPYCFLHISKAEIDLPSGIDIYDDSVYQKSKENFERFIKEGILRQDLVPCFYVYRQIMPVEGGHHSQVGLVAGASVDEYQKDIILKHEQTRQDKEDDRTRNVDTLNANTGPVFLTYIAKPGIDAIIDKVMEGTTENDFTSDDGIRHTFWVVSDKKIIEKLEEEFASLDHLYVADGHHRSASASRVRDMRMKENPGHTGDEEYNFFLAVIFPHNQMQIMDYNRVIKDLNGLSKEEFMEKAAEKFDIEAQDAPLYKPSEKNSFGLYISGKWYRLKPLPGTFDERDAVESLDVSILQKNLLDPVLGIKNPRTDKRIDFVGGIRGIKELVSLVDSGKFKAAFALYPTSINDLIEVADAGKFMPPKSTWFEPKLRSGLAIHLLK